MLVDLDAVALRPGEFQAESGMRLDGVGSTGGWCR